MATKEEIQKALELMAKTKDRQRKQTAKSQVLIQMAKAAKFHETDEFKTKVEAYLAK